jgi:hypothetical protein
MPCLFLIVSFDGSLLAVVPPFELLPLPDLQAAAKIQIAKTKSDKAILFFIWFSPVGFESLEYSFQAVALFSEEAA